MIKVLGAAYLVYLGVRAILERPQHAGMSGAVRITPPQALRQAILAEVLNPQSALFFLAFLPQFFIWGQYTNFLLRICCSTSSPNERFTSLRVKSRQKNSILSPNFYSKALVQSIASTLSSGATSKFGPTRVMRLPASGKSMTSSGADMPPVR